MTQPSYPPQGYAPQAPPQYPPAPQYGPPPGYAPAYPQAPQYQQAPAQPAHVPPQAPPAPGYGGAHPQGPAPSLSNPDAPQSNVIRPRLIDFGREGRLVLITPIKVERDKPNNLGKPGDTQDRMTADVVILDGAPFPFGGSPEKDPTKPHHLTAQIPYESLSMFISSGPLISQVERHMNEPVCGRLRTKQLANGNTAYTLDSPTDTDKAQATAFLIAKAEGRIATPTPAPAPQPYGPPANAPAPQYAQGGPVPPQGAYMTQPAPLPAYAPAQQGYAPAPQYAPAAVDIDTAPAHIDPAWWAAQPPDARAMMLQQRPGV